jgi:hypothetical protein
MPSTSVLSICMQDTLNVLILHNTKLFQSNEPPPPPQKNYKFFYEKPMPISLDMHLEVLLYNFLEK